jgi:single stranded DNA-binding protein
MNTIEEELAGETMPTEKKSDAKSARTHWNWIQLSGRIASEVEKKSVKDQTVIEFTLLFETLRKTDKEGSHANFIQVELWGKMAELFYPLLGKGIEILVTGELFQQRWLTKENQKAQKYSISAQALAISDQKFRPS